MGASRWAWMMALALVACGDASATGASGTGAGGGGGGLCARAGGGLRSALLHHGFGRALREYLVGFVQQVLQIFLQRFPETVPGLILDLDARGVAGARNPSATSRQCAGRNLGIGRYRSLYVARHVDVIDLVVPEVRRVGHHSEIRAIKFEAHVDLLGNAGQKLRQRLVDGVHADIAGDSRMNVDVQLGITCKSEKQILNLDVIDHDAIGFSLLDRSGSGEGSNLLNGLRNHALRLRDAFCAQMPG